MNRILTTSLALACAGLATHALRLEPIKYGDMENWVTRNITESKIIGGNDKTLYEIAPRATVNGNKTYSNTGGSPWGTSNAFAKVCGVVKGSTTVEPAKRGGSTVAKCSAKMEHVKALGLVNMDVMVAGSIYLGELFEPVTSTKNAYGKMEMGIPYTKRPKALVYDFEIAMPASDTRTKSTGFSKKQTLQGRDNAEVYVLLQRRWEDKDGNIYAKRVGTGRERYAKSVPWTKAHELPIHYGDISKEAFYKPWMGLIDGEKAYYARNSKGKMVPIHEVGWDSPDATPTHVMMMASSSCGEAFIGSEGLTLYIDNINFGF